MNDLAKLFAAAAGGAVAMHLFRNYQDEREIAAQRAAFAARNPVQRLADTATGVIRDLVPASQMQGMHGMHGHMPMPAPPQGFYAQGVRQSNPGNPHAPVMIPGRATGRMSAAPPPPPPAPDAAETGYEDYGGDNVMGGQSF